MQIIKKRIHSFRKNKRGLSLLEMVVVIGIVTVSLVSISSLMTQSIQAQNINHNYLIASMLAQEGLELVRNKRDTNWLRPGWDWKTGNNPGTDVDIFQFVNGQTYAISSGTIDSTVNNISDAGAVLYQSIYGHYTHDTTGNSLYTGADPTIFSRLITVDDLGGETDILEIVCTVQWELRGKIYKYEAATKSYNWFP